MEILSRFFWTAVLLVIIVLALLVCLVILIIRAICNYQAKRIAAEMRKQQGELARAIAEELYWHRRQESGYQESGYLEEAE